MTEVLGPSGPVAMLFESRSNVGSLGYVVSGLPTTDLAGGAT